LASFTAAGHVSAAPPAVWLRLALWAHLIGVACWLTAPVLLWPARSRDDAIVLARTQAFSQLATGIVPVALVAGLILAAVLIEEPGDAIATAYGRLIVIKAFAASAAFALGALNKVWVTRRLMDDPQKGRAALKATLAADAVLFATALIAVAGATTVFAP
jgi:putative copper export protein